MKHKLFLMAIVKISATEKLTLHKKCGNSSWILIREKKEFRIIHSEMLYSIKRAKNDFQIGKFASSQIEKN
jgi:hypothetical protein